MVLQLTAKKIDVSMDVPGGTQSFNLSETSAKFQINNSFSPLNGGANNILITESKNSYNGGFRWKHTTAYNVSPSASPGTYKLYRFINDGSEIETEILSIGSTGNITFDNDVTVNGTLFQNILAIPSIIDVSGTTQTFQYNGDHTAKFALKNLYAASVGTPSTVELDFVNSTTGGYRLVHSSATTDTSGLGTFELKILNSLGTSVPVFTTGIIGAVTYFEVHGKGFFNGTNTFNQGGIGESIFEASATFNAAALFNGTVEFDQDVTFLQNALLATVPTLGGHLTNKTYVDSVAGNVSSLINVSGSSQTFSFSAGTQNDSFNIENTYTPAVGFSPVNSLNLKNVHGAGYALKYVTTSTAYNNIGLFYFNMFNPTLSVNENIWSIVPDAGGTIMSIFPGIIFNVASSNIQFSEPLGTFQCAPSAEFLGTVIVQTPTLGTQAANKTYVDNSISGYVGSNPITLTGAVTGINSITNPIFTSLASTLPLTGATQTFNFSLNSNVVYRLNNTLAATTGTPSTIALRLNNATNGGHRLLHTSTSTDVAGIGTLALQTINSSGVIATHFTASVNTGNGIPDILFNGTATFNNDVTVQNNKAILVTGNSAVADYLVMNNTNLSSKTQLRINVTGLPVATFGYDSALSQVYIDSPFSGGSPFLIKFGGTTRFSMNNITGNIDLFSSRITNAANPVNPQDLTTKNYVDSLITPFGPNVPLNFSGLNFNWAYASSTNPTPYEFTNKFTDSQISKNFKYRVLTNDVLNREWNHEYTLIGNSDVNGIYKINYIVSGTTFTPINIQIYPFATSQNLMNVAVPINMGGYEIRNALNPTAPQSLATKSYVDSTVGSSSVTLTGAVTGSGAGTINTTLTPTVNINSASYAFNLNNANSSGITEFQISYGIPYLKFGVNTSGAGNYIDSIFDNFIIKMGGTNRFIFSNAGNLGIGGSGPIEARLVVNGGVQNVTGEDTAMRVISSSTNVKIELQNTSVSGKLYELGSTSTGSFVLNDRTANANRYTIDTNGNHVFSNTTFGRRCSGTISMQNNAVTTTVVTAGTYVKLNGTTSASNLNQLTSPVSNRITFTGATSSVALITASVTALHSGGGGDELTFAFYKNGTQISTSIASSQNINNYGNISLVTTTSVVTNDYIEVWVTSSVNNRIVTPKHLSITFTTV